MVAISKKEEIIKQNYLKKSKNENLLLRELTLLADKKRHRQNSFYFS